MLRPQLSSLSPAVGLYRSLGLPRFSGQVSGLHGCECTGVDELLLVVDRAEVANRLVTTLAVVVTVDPEGHLPDQLLWAVQDLCIVIEAQFVFEGGEEALHHGVVPAAALGRHAAADLVVVQQLPVRRCPVLAPLIGVDQEPVGFDLWRCPRARLRTSSTDVASMVVPTARRRRGGCTGRSSLPSAPIGATPPGTANQPLF